MFREKFANWQDSSFTGLGQQFVSVRVLRRRTQTIRRRKPAPSSPAASVPSANLISLERAGRTIGESITKLGRPSRILPALIELTQRLQTSGELDGLLRKQQLALIQERSQREKPAMFIRPPSRVSVLEAMKRPGIL